MNYGSSRTQPTEKTPAFVLSSKHLKDSVNRLLVFEIELSAKSAQLAVANGEIDVNETKYNISMVRLDRAPEEDNKVPWAITIGPFEKNSDREMLVDLLNDDGIPIFYQHDRTTRD